MRVLLLISEMWNDKTHPNNNMSNWFKDFDDVEIATVTGGPGTPLNNCCKKYFQLTDKTMLDSIMGKGKAGKILSFDDYPAGMGEELSASETAVYKNTKKLHFELARLARDLIWRFGRYDKELLKKFIDDFKPDIIFTQRLGSIKMCRMEKIVSSLCNAPMVAYTGDDEYSFTRFSMDPVYLIRQAWRRSWLRRQYKTYKLFYGMSEEQLSLFQSKFGVQTKFLVKCGDFKKEKIHKSVGNPIKIVYGGKLYAGRWKTLSILADEIRKINKDGKKFELYIYTPDSITKKQNELLNDGNGSYIMGKVSAEELSAVYDSSDIVLHVEGLDKKNARLTRYSFSTKIIDCLSSGAAVMAICDKNQAGYAYLSRKDAALVADNRKMIAEHLDAIAKNKEIIPEYSEKAYITGVSFHSRKEVQKEIYKDFEKVIQD